MRNSWLLISFFTPVSNFTTCFFHTDRALLIIRDMSGLMVLEPFGMNCMSLLLPLWAGVFQLLEGVSEGQGEFELICLSILHSDDVVLFEQVLDSLVELDKIEKLDRVVVIVLSVKIALDNNIRLEFSSLSCQRCLCCTPLMASWTMRLQDRRTWWCGWMSWNRSAENGVVLITIVLHVLVTSLSKDFAIWWLRSVAGWTMPSASPICVALLDKASAQWRQVLELVSQLLSLLSLQAWDPNVGGHTSYRDKLDHVHTLYMTLLLRGNCVICEKLYN